MIAPPFPPWAEPAESCTDPEEPPLPLATLTEPLVPLAPPAAVEILIAPLLDAAAVAAPIPLVSVTDPPVETAEVPALMFTKAPAARPPSDAPAAISTPPMTVPEASPNESPVSSAMPPDLLPVLVRLHLPVGGEETAVLSLTLATLATLLFRSALGGALAPNHLDFLTFFRGLALFLCHLKYHRYFVAFQTKIFNLR